MLTLLMALAIQVGPTPYQAAPSQTSPAQAAPVPTAPPVQATPAPESLSPEAFVLPGATLASDCGGLYGLAGRAFCVTAPLAGIGALADAYIADLATRQWEAAGGDDNRVVFIRRHADGTCDGLQMQAFYDINRPAAPEAPGYLAFATIPGDVCRAPAAVPAPAPAAPPPAVQ